MAWYESMYEIIIGCGHLWYLPMIFWCFVTVINIIILVDENSRCNSSRFS